jgi:hypothetical protein
MEITHHHSLTGGAKPCCMTYANWRVSSTVSRGMWLSCLHVVPGRGVNHSVSEERDREHRSLSRQEPLSTAQVVQCGVLIMATQSTRWYR